MSDYLRPSTLADALAHLGRGPVTVLAGGTDLFPATDATRLSGRVLDLGAIADLRGISVAPDGGLRLGACTTWDAIRRAELPAPAGPALAALRAAAAEVGGRQIQAAGTIGGNLCNASPAADGVPPLLVLDAEVVLERPGAVRRMPLAQFLAGPRRTERAADELLTAIHVPARALSGRSVFLKLGARRHLVISIAMVAARLRVEGGRVVEAALAVGACSAVATRLAQVEADLIGAAAEVAASRVDPARVAAALSPLDDVRGSAAYRAEAAAELVRRAVDAAVGRAEGIAA